jgi:uncharacterized protein
MPARSSDVERPSPAAAGAPSSAEPATSSGVSGVGLGLRWSFLEELLDHPAEGLSFVEISPENYMRRGGYFPAALSRVGERFAVLSHGLTMSIGGTDPLDDAYLAELRKFLGRVRAPFHSDHLCWSGTDQAMLHDLLPLPFTREAVAHVCDRIERVRTRLGTPFAIENVTYYAPLGTPEMKEEEFLGEVLEKSGAGLLLDVNNVYVNSLNHGFDAVRFLETLPLDRVLQLHVAGHHTWDDGLVVDTHGADVPDPVYALMEWVIERTGPLPVILERDQEVPTLDQLLAEVARLRRSYDAALERGERARGGTKFEARRAAANEAIDGHAGLSRS